MQKCQKMSEHVQTGPDMSKSTHKCQNVVEKCLKKIQKCQKYPKMSKNVNAKSGNKEKVWGSFCQFDLFVLLYLFRKISS